MVSGNWSNMIWHKWCSRECLCTVSLTSWIFDKYSNWNPFASELFKKLPVDRIADIIFLKVRFFFKISIATLKSIYGSAISFCKNATNIDKPLKNALTQSFHTVLISVIYKLIWLNIKPLELVWNIRFIYIYIYMCIVKFSPQWIRNPIWTPIV